MKIIFMGTPEFAVPALNALIGSKHKVLAVYSQPPRPAGRGHKLQKSPVHEIAEKNNIPVYTPETLKNPETQKQFKDIGADAAVVAAYGLLLPKPILEACRFGCINIHPSLLPRWRGAAPIQRAIMAGDKETGVCIMQMNEGLDTGDVLLTEKYNLYDKSIGLFYPFDSHTVTDSLARISAKLIVEAMDKIESGETKATPQSNDGVTYAKKITKEDSKIDWKKSALEIEAQIRGLAPKPGAYFVYKGDNIKVTEAESLDEKNSLEPGTVQENLVVKCGAGSLKLLKLQRPGKNLLNSTEFSKGFPIPAGNKLE